LPVCFLLTELPVGSGNPSGADRGVGAAAADAGDVRHSVPDAAPGGTDSDLATDGASQGLLQLGRKCQAQSHRPTASTDWRTWNR